MGPTVKTCTDEYKSKSVEFVTFDFTSDKTTAAAKAKAKELGIDKLYAEKAGRTGFVLLYDTATKKVVGTLSARQDLAAWRTQIDKVLGS